MATRFYFPLNTAAPLSVSFAAGWDYTTEALTRKLSKTKGTSAITIGQRIGPWTAGQDALDRQYVSDPMPAGKDFTGCTVKMQLMTREYAAQDNSKARIVLKIVNSLGVLQQTLLGLADYGNNTEFVNNATHRNHTFANGDTVSGTYVTSAGDRLVVEIGYSDSAGSTPEASAKWGEDATDLPEDETQTSNGAGWLELSVNVFQRSKTFTTDAALKKQQNKTFTIDGIKKKAFIKAFSVDAILKKLQSKAFSMDAELIAGGPTTRTKTFLIDAALKKLQSVSSAADAALKKALTKTFDADGALKKAQTKTFAVNKTIDYGSDGNYLGGDGNYIIGDGNYIGDDFSDPRKAFTADAALKKALTKTFTIDAHLFVPPKAFLLADAVLVEKVRDIQKTFTVDADVRNVSHPTKTFTADAKIVLSITGVTFTVDAGIKAAKTKTFRCDGIITLSGTLAAPYQQDVVHLSSSSGNAYTHGSQGNVDLPDSSEEAYLK